MMRKILAAAAVATLLSAAASAAAPPQSWDGLVLVKSERLDAVYLAPDADFRTYSKVMFDPTEVALKKNWLRDYNSTTTGISRRISEKDVQKAMETIRTKFADTFTKAYTDAGWQVVTAPGPDVLRVRTAVINLDVNAPDVMSAGRVRSYAREAGEATLVLEARDSESGAILGRALDRRLAGNTSAYLRNSVTNKRDFERLFTDWGKISAAGLNTLKQMSPVNVASGAPPR